MERDMHTHIDIYALIGKSQRQFFLARKSTSGGCLFWGVLSCDCMRTWIIELNGGGLTGSETTINATTS